MKICNYKFKSRRKIVSCDVEEFIQKHTAVEEDSCLSDWFQVLYDSPNVAVWRLNYMLGADDSYLGVIVRINLNDNTIEIGNDCSVEGRVVSYKEKKCNFTFTNKYQLA